MQSSFRTRSSVSSNQLSSFVAAWKKFLMEHNDREYLIEKEGKNNKCSKKVFYVTLLVVLIFLFLAWAVVMTIFWAKCADIFPGHDGRTKVDCKVVIIGTGFAGSFAAYSLAPIYGDSLCIIEKLSRDGGRVLDVARTEGGPVFGVGALRVTSTQLTMLKLSEELGIEMQLAEEDTELLKVRGKYFYRAITQSQSESFKMCKEAFNFDCSYFGNGTDTDVAMLKLLLDTYKNDSLQADKHPDFPTYILSLVGDEGLAFVRESVRYNSPFTAISTRGVLDFFTNELAGMGLDPDRYYPKGGMSEYIRKMLTNATEAGVKIYRSEPVQSIESDLKNPNAPFIIKTPHFFFQADKVLSSIDPLALIDVKGNVAEKIKEAKEFKMIAPKALSIVTAWWPERWWERSKLAQISNLSRAVSHQNCFNTMDIPTFPYGRDQNVTRAVYDDGACVDTWRGLVSNVSNERLVAYNTSDLQMLADEVVSSLKYMFTNITIPYPTYLHGFVHENAWHFQHPISDITNKQILEWSLHPLPNKNIALIGEAYNLNFAAWCDGALKSTMTVLTNYYNFNFPCLNDTGSPAKCPTVVSVANDGYSEDDIAFRLHNLLP